MEGSTVFSKIRNIAFSCIMFTSFLWIVFLCFDIYVQWDSSDRPERSLVVVILLANAMTVIMLPILMLLPFRAWLDATRFMFLLVAHIGTAASFAYWYPKISCPDQNADKQGVCKLFNIYILVASWVVPVLLLTYCCGLALMVYRRSRQSLTVMSLKSDADSDEETAMGRRSILPMMQPPLSSASITFPSNAFITAPVRNPPENPTRPPLVHTRSSDDSQSSGRLSKRLPSSFF